MPPKRSPSSSRTLQRLRRLLRAEFLRRRNEAAAYLREVDALAATRPRRSLRIKIARDNERSREVGEPPEFSLILFGERGFGDSAYDFPLPADGYWLLTHFDWELDSD